jgi:RNA 2',3'-cyclic 3'-phosphodiesterase
MKRVFIAVKVNPEDKLLNMISLFRAGLKEENIKWTDPDNFHITLAFLGATEEHNIKLASKMLMEVCKGSPAFEIIIRGAGVFKNLKNPRVIWTATEPSEELILLQDNIKLGLKDIGISIEERAFSPHLTLGRIKSIKSNIALESLITKYGKDLMQRQAVYEIILYESILMHSGPVYKPLGKFALVKA